MNAKTPKAAPFWLLVPVPAILGMVGFYLEGEGFWNAAYSCLTMYLIDFGDSISNPWLQTARWLAPLATASGLALAFSSVRRFVKRMYARCSKDSIAVFGSGAEKQALLNELGLRGLDTSTDGLRAARCILVGSEEENLDFYAQNTAAFANKDVYLKCRSLPEQSGCDPKLHLFSPEETSARLFWDTYCPYDLSAAAGHHMKIAVFGFGRLGSELLIQGLQYNIFSPDQVIEYHIFGEAEGFVDTHPQLRQITDPVIFHSDPWYSAAELLADCQMMIVVRQEGQLELLQQITLLFPQTPVHVFSAQPSGTAVLEKHSKLICFDWKAESIRLDAILNERLHTLAKKLNLRYAHLYQNVPETAENMEAEWLKLNAFTRYSNISAANYHKVCMRILNGEVLSDERLRLLGELEHIRWCRYHYLNNWAYGVPENGKAKDPAKRIHKLLIPNADLPENEQEKDRENVRLLMELQKGSTSTT